MNIKSEKILFFSIVIFIGIYFLFGLGIPFFLFNKLISWDMTGLYFSTWYEKEYLFPDAIGWNPFFFLGYAEHQFYPPLFSYISALLGFFIPLEYAFKTIFVISLFLMPVSFYFFTRAFYLSRARAAICTMVMTSLLFVFPNEIFGGNIHSVFKIGLIVQTLGMAMFFFYWAEIERSWNSKRYILAGVLMSLIILTHIIAAFVAVFLFVSYLICKVRKKEDLIFFVKHGLIAALLSSFWVVPFIGKIKWLEAYPVGSISYSLLFLLLSFVFLAIYLYKKSDKFICIPVLVLVLLLSCFIFVELGMPLHSYRFMMFLYILVPVLFFSLFKKDNLTIYSAIFIVSALIILNASVYPKGPEDMDVSKIIFDDLSKKNIDNGSRIYVLSSYSKESSSHVLQHKIPMQSRVNSLRGLYIESAKNARYIFNLENQFEPRDSVVWGTYINENYILDDLAKIGEIVPFQLNLFGVSGVVAVEDYGLQWNNRQNISSYENDMGENYVYSFYNSGISSIIEVLNYSPRMINSSEWNERTAEWFLSEDIKKGILVNEKVPIYFGNGSEKIEILEISRRNDYIKFKVDSLGKVPILIKISEFPNWKAYEFRDGKREKIKIYRASPYLMLIYGKGEIEMRYEKMFIDKLGEILSLIGLIFIILFYVNKWKRVK